MGGDWRVDLWLAIKNAKGAMVKITSQLHMVIGGATSTAGTVSAVGGGAVLELAQ